uniref:Glutamine amidotransferase class-II n=1 Tax=Cyanothece sp. (strain PCC 7425 / ATCC 29141) TaxID=395961 RepID=B8HYA2_CYAP4
MCRLLGYLGPSLQLADLLLKPDHSLMVQSYQPKEMTSGVLNADGFGVGWYGHPSPSGQADLDPPFPYVYRNTLPIWSDENLEDLCRYVQSPCVLANVRSATAGQPVQLSNCQPFRFGQILAVHNGYIENFRQTLYRPLRDRLSDNCYQMIKGTTDSEHLFALFCQHYLESPHLSLVDALRQTLELILKLAAAEGIKAGLNLILSDGNQLVACRSAYPSQPPSLYWLEDDPTFARSKLIVSEPIFSSDHWRSFANDSVLVLGEDLEPQTYQL